MGAIEILSIAFAAASAIVAALAFRRSTTKDASDSGKSGGIVLTEIGYIKSGVDDIKRHQEKQDDRYLELRQRVTTLESATQEDRRRIEEIAENCKEHHECLTRKE